MELVIIFSSPIMHFGSRFNISSLLQVRVVHWSVGRARGNDYPPGLIKLVPRLV